MVFSRPVNCLAGIVSRLATREDSLDDDLTEPESSEIFECVGQSVVDGNLVEVENSLWSGREGSRGGGAQLKFTPTSLPQ